MRRIIFPTLALLLLAVNFSPLPAVAAPGQEGIVEQDSGSVICPPGAYTTPPDDCLPLGPSEYIAGLTQKGIPWPIQSLPAYKPEAALNDIPFRYFKVADSGTYVFPSMEAAASEETSGLPIGPGHILFVAYQQRIDTDSGVYYLLENGGWIRGDGSQYGLHMPFQGLLFSSMPRNSFGWALGEIQSHVAPGFQTPYTNRTYYRYNVVQIYAIEYADGVNWYLVGPDEWLEGGKVARFDPSYTAPEGVTTGRWIEINLYEQTLAVYEENRLIFATMVSSGYDPFWTQPGLFQVYQKKPVETMSGSFEADRSDYYYLENVPWTMYYDGKRALHGAYWHDFFGYTLSHGCVNMSLGDSHWLYDWAREGDWVYVHDPSGQTPTDPALYGAGAP